jgi:NTE family protein
MKKIGLALGGGGAKGFAHLPILEVFDELNIKPYCITGTSVGSILGALYASGKSAAEILEMINRLIISRKKPLKEIFKNKDMLRVFELIDPSFKPGGFLKGDKFLQFLCAELRAETFEELEIPFKTVATDFWRREEVVFDSGNLLTAIRASIAIPYIFTPVIQETRVLVDGGLVNNVPSDLLDPACDITIAVDIAGDVTTPRTKVPSPIDAMFHTYQVMMNATTHEKLKRVPVDIYVTPPILDIDMLDFHKAEAIYAQGLASKAAFKAQLIDLLETRGGLNWFRKRGKR